jgi:hypothetical protein
MQMHQALVSTSPVTALIVQVEDVPGKLPSTSFLANFRFADYPGMIEHKEQTT